mmetsp:Transcript_32646/g.56425  ORF Transcript_32646/g.56425 Transcript_32646/m.56425 type:complete len:205 (+) Transcript_32646:427-1041(+)
MPLLQWQMDGALPGVPQQTQGAHNGKKTSGARWAIVGGHRVGGRRVQLPPARRALATNALEAVAGEVAGVTGAPSCTLTSGHKCTARTLPQLRRTNGGHTARNLRQVNRAGGALGPPLPTAAAAAAESTTRLAAEQRRPAAGAAVGAAMAGCAVVGLLWAAVTKNGNHPRGPGATLAQRAPRGSGMSGPPPRTRRSPPSTGNTI